MMISGNKACTYACMYRLIYYKKINDHKKYLAACGLLEKTQRLCKELSLNPKPQGSKQLAGDLQGKRSVRINLKHRLVYQIVEEEKIIKILSMCSHYD